MKTVNSVSGGQTSAYLMANYPADFNLYAFVETEKESCRYKGEHRQYAEDKLGRTFVGTLEDDVIIQTLRDLEQYTGQGITWVDSPTFEQVRKKKGKYLPNKAQRYCTQEMKVRPIAQHVVEKIGAPVVMRFGYRASEQGRAKKMLERCNEDGLIVAKVIYKRGKRNRWAEVPYQKPEFPLIADNVRRDTIVNYWRGKPVKFAVLNNCVTCFHRNAMALNQLAQLHPEKFEYWAQLEQDTGGRFKTDVTYREIIDYRTQLSLPLADIEDEACGTGYCGL